MIKIEEEIEEDVIKMVIRTEKRIEKRMGIERSVVVVGVMLEEDEARVVAVPRLNRPAEKTARREPRIGIFLLMQQLLQQMQQPVPTNKRIHQVLPDAVMGLTVLHTEVFTRHQTTLLIPRTLDIPAHQVRDSLRICQGIHSFLLLYDTPFTWDLVLCLVHQSCIKLLNNSSNCYNSNNDWRIDRHVAFTLEMLTHMQQRQWWRSF